MPRLARTVLLTGVAICAAVAVAPSVAGADIARLEPITQHPTTQPLDHQIAVTDRHGAQRTVGPVPDGRLVAAPDGRHLAVVPSGDDGPGTPWIVPLDGSPARQVRLPPGTAVIGYISKISWTLDGSELLIGDVLDWDPDAFARPSTFEDLRRAGWTALRCPIATGACSELPAPNGIAVGVPDGILTTSSAISSFPTAWTFDGMGDERPPEWERPTSRRARLWTRIADDVRVTSTQLVGSPAKTLGRARRSGSAGIPVALAAVGGPGGAVISRATFAIEVERRRERVRQKLRIHSPRFLLARPGAPLRAFASRPIVLPRRDRRRIDAGTATPGQRLHFRPQFATPGGWVGGGGATALGAGDTAVLATMDAEGKLHPVTVQGRAATAWALLRAVHGRSPGRVTDPIEIVGYEATGNLIVTIHYQPPSKNSQGRSNTLRVPLEGSALPTVIRGRVDAAW